MVDQKLWILRKRFLKNFVAYLRSVVSLSCLFIRLLSTFWIPEASFGVNTAGSRRTTELRKFAKGQNLGTFGEMMIEMLQQALAFTVFVPSERAFEHDLRLHVKESPAEDNINNTYAIGSRCPRFHGCPSGYFSGHHACGQVDLLRLLVEVHFVHLEGCRWKVRSESANIRSGEVVVHIMGEVIMDADFRQPFQSDDDVDG